MADEEQLEYQVYFMGKLKFAAQMQNLEKKKAGGEVTKRDLGRTGDRRNFVGRVSFENKNQEMKGIRDRCIDCEWGLEEICEEEQSLSEQEIKIVENDLDLIEEV